MEDQPALRRSIARDLKERFDVLATGSHADAIAALDSAEYDVVVSDLDLGEGLSGLDVLRHARHTRPATGRILISGSVLSAGLSDAVGDDTVQRFLPKPFGREALFSAIDELLSPPSRAQTTG